MFKGTEMWPLGGIMFDITAGDAVSITSKDMNFILNYAHQKNYSNNKTLLLQEFDIITDISDLAFFPLSVFL